ncbi:hypothetical protein [Actinomadura rubrisoli]|uniref:Uncharacterized protein n=1 Tax=Actinomadura rubrisoli TaxID=2530368 RepID=A0A4V2YTR2_9ACTN|nr:hypothetical protein [Actinomadura rubrisoli]TDD74837.1 hypothetical protein E1298_32090 [Actinomadura rubrisoli]
MIIPLRFPDGKLDYSRLGEWFALCDVCCARTLLSRVDDWLIPRTTGGRVYCPRCACRTAEQLLAEASPAGPRRRARVAVAWLWTALRLRVHRLTYRPRHGR